MSGLFASIGIAGSGVDAMQTWINATAGNVANANDTVALTQPAYAEETTILSPAASAVPGQPGAGVTATVRLGSSTGIVAYEPRNPLASPQGLVRVPDVSMSSELVNLIQAQAGYQANTAVLQKAVAAYQAGLEIGT